MGEILKEEEKEVYLQQNEHRKACFFNNFFSLSLIRTKIMIQLLKGYASFFYLFSSHFIISFPKYVPLLFGYKIISFSLSISNIIRNLKILSSWAPTKLAEVSWQAVLLEQV